MSINSGLKFVDKWLILSVFIFTIGTTKLCAQQFAVGVKAGPLTSLSVYGDKDDGDQFDTRAVFGYYAAGIISFPLKKNYSCIIEGGFSQKGRSVIFNEGSGKNKATYYYTDAALLLRRSFKVQLAKNLPANVFVNIGPHINYWLSGKGTIGTVENDGSPYTVVFEQEPNLEQFDKMFLNEVNRWMFGLDIGVGMMAPITPKQNILVELRFTSGHTFYGERNSATYSWVEFQDNLRANDKVLSITAAYTFGFDIKESKMGTSTKDKEVHRKKVNKKKKRKPRSSLFRL